MFTNTKNKINIELCSQKCSTNASRSYSAPNIDKLNNLIFWEPQFAKSTFMFNTIINSKSGYHCDNEIMFINKTVIPRIMIYVSRNVCYSSMPVIGQIVR